MSMERKGSKVNLNEKFYINIINTCTILYIHIKWKNIKKETRK